MNQVTVKQDNLPAESIESWGQTSQMSSQDMVLAKILAMQMMSQKVVDQQAVFGEFRDSINNIKLGSFTEPVEILPFHMDKVFVEFEVGKNDKKEFKRIVPIVTDATNPNYNDELPYEEVVDGVKISRDRMLNFYVLLPKEINPELADVGGGTLPYIVGFRRSSLRGGKKIATQMYVANAAARKAPAAAVMELMSVKKTNDDGTFVVMDARLKRPTSAEELKAAFYWFQQVKKGATKVDHSDLTEDTESSTSVSEPERF